MLKEFTMTAAMIMGLGATAHARPDRSAALSGGGFSVQCTKTCFGGGFRVEVLKHDTLTAYKLRLMPQDAVWFSDWDAAIPDATFVANQEGGYQYCDEAGLYIYGDVYLNWALSEWHYAETPTLHAPSPCGWASMDDLLDELEAYNGNEFTEIPEFCEDLGCYPTGGGSSSGGSNPRPHVSGYTDASGEFHRH